LERAPGVQGRAKGHPGRRSNESRDNRSARQVPPHFKVPPHTHPYSEVVTVLSGTYWNAMGDDMEKGVMLKSGSVFVPPANHIHHTWTTDEEVILQIYFTDPGGITFINPADDPRKKAE
jgi:mannose-6-phosphate isomerase-like protein (cupin superfamily)